MHPQQNSRPRAASQVPAPASPGPVAAWQRPLVAAESAAAQGDWAGVAHKLAASVRAYAGLVAPGRLYELWATCGAEGATRMAVLAAFERALHAYQEEHEVAGMARCHFQLGEVHLATGELERAEREYGYAHDLFGRHGSPYERTRSRSCQAFVALQRGHGEAALGHADAALQLAKQLAAPAAVEAGARLIRAQAFAALGQAQAAARDLLWAERLLAADQGHVTPQLLLVRAESLLGLGYPRRARSVLSALGGLLDGGPMPGSRTKAQATRLEGEATLGDDPQRAYALLYAAQRQFVALDQPYYRVACEISLTRAAHRCGEASLGARLEALAGGKLGRWPRLHAAHEQLLHEIDRPEVTIPGAVRAPWVKAVGHYRGQVDLRGGKAAVQGEAEPGQVGGQGEVHAGLLDRLQGAWGRWRAPQG